MEVGGSAVKFEVVAGVRWCLLAVMTLAVLPAADAAAGMAEQARERGIVIVPLESPPLTFGPGIDAEQALAANTGAGLSWAASEAVAEAGRTLFAISGIVILASLPERTRQADKQATSAEAILNAADVWVPTVALAEEAQALLQQAGDWSVRRSDQVRPVPGIEKRERTITMHNWYQPIATWYGMSKTPFSYAAPEVNPGERVLEVALSNFELGPGRVLYVLVSTKLVDPATGKVVSKARRMVYPETADAKALFAGDASAFKQTFAAAGRDALRSNLRSMGLVPK
jgi:hypothetical protein